MKTLNPLPFPTLKDIVILSVLILIIDILPLRGISRIFGKIIYSDSRKKVKSLLISPQ